MQLQDKQRLLFTGDSITDCQRSKVPGDGRHVLGRGYVSFVDARLGAGHPERRIQVLNTGISGNRVTDLAARWQEDVVGRNPDWLSVMIGINDVWRQFDSPHMKQVSIEAYETSFRDLLMEIRPKLSGLVLMTPYFLEKNRSDPMRVKMDAYGAVVEKLAAELDAVFVDTQRAFDEHLEHRPTQMLCGDRVHPNAIGHMILANAFLDAVGANA